MSADNGTAQKKTQNVLTDAQKRKLWAAVEGLKPRIEAERMSAGMVLSALAEAGLGFPVTVDNVKKAAAVCEVTLARRVDRGNGPQTRTRVKALEAEVSNLLGILAEHDSAIAKLRAEVSMLRGNLEQAGRLASQGQRWGLVNGQAVKVG